MSFSRAVWALSVVASAGCGASSPEHATAKLVVSDLAAPAPFDPESGVADLRVGVRIESLSKGSYTLVASFELVQGGGIPVRTLTDSIAVSGSGTFELGVPWDGNDASGARALPDTYEALVGVSLRRGPGTTGEPVAEVGAAHDRQLAHCSSSAGCVPVALCASADSDPERCRAPYVESDFVCSVLGAFVGPDPRSSWNFSGTDASPPLILPIALSPNDRLPENVPPGEKPNAAANPVIVGSDLGSPFEHTAADGTRRMVFLFGDTEPVPERSYAHDENGDIYPSGSPFTQLPTNDDSMAWSDQADDDPPSGADRCLDLDFFAGGAGQDPVHQIEKQKLFEPITLNGPLAFDLAQPSVSGTNLGFARVSGPGFSMGNRMFALMPADSDPTVGVGCDATHPCLLNEVCMAEEADGLTTCHYGDCSKLDGSTPCFRRNARATIATNDGFSPSFRSLKAAEVETVAGVSALDVYRGRADIVPPVAFHVASDHELYVWGRDRVMGHPDDFGSPPQSGRAELEFWTHEVTQGAGGPKLGMPKFFSGCDDDPNTCDAPRFSEDPKQALPVYTEDRLIVNQTSVTWFPSFGRWVMIYGGRLPLWARSFYPVVTAARSFDPYIGIVMRTAKHPWGPWSSPVTIYDPHWSNVAGYCEILFRDPSYDSALDERVGTGFAEKSCDPSAVAELHAEPGAFGVEYGAAILPRFIQDTPERASFFWLMSTMNPYRVVLMKTVLQADPTP